MLNRTQFPQKPCSGRDCCLFWLQHIVRTHWRNQSTPSDTLGIGLEMPVWSFFFLLRKLVGILKRVTHAIIFRLLGLRKVAHGLEHLCATSMSLGSISNPEPTCQTESNPKIYKYILKCQLITCCFSALPFPLEGSLRSAQGTLRWSAFTALFFLTVWGSTWSSIIIKQTRTPEVLFYVF